MLTLALGEAVRPGGLLASVARRLGAIAVSLGLMVVLAVALRARPVAQADAAVVRLLSDARGAALTDVMTYLTLMGDVVPTLVLATVLAMYVHRQGLHRFAGWLLPILLVVELLVQVAIGAVIDPLTVADIHPDIVLDGAGYLPSGSLARLGALTLGGAYLVRPTSPQAAGGLVSVGSVLLLVEAVTRLYLARHLGLDLLGGLLLGLALFLTLTLLVPHPHTAGWRPMADGPRSRP